MATRRKTSKPKAGLPTPEPGTETEAQPVAEAAALETPEQAKPVMPRAIPTREELDVIEFYLKSVEEAGKLPYPKPMSRLLMLRGWDLGISPLTAITQLVPGDEPHEVYFEKAEYMRQAIQRAGGIVRPLEMSETLCRLQGERWVHGEKVVAEYQYSIQEAQRQGKLGGGGQWDTDRVSMLFARCTTRLGRAMFADVISGCSYTAEEVRTAKAGPAQAPQMTPSAEGAASPPVTAPAQEQPAAPTPPASSSPSSDADRPVQEQPASPPQTIQAERVGSRVLDHPVSFVGGDGTAKQVFTAGANQGELAGIMKLCENHDANTAYVKALLEQLMPDREEGKAAVLRGLTDREAKLLLATLQTAERPSAATLFAEPQSDGKAPLTLDDAMAIFAEAVTNTAGQEYVQAADVLIAAQYDHLALKDMEPEAVKEAANDWKRLFRENSENVMMALQMAQRQLQASQPPAAS